MAYDFGNAKIKRSYRYQCLSSSPILSLTQIVTKDPKPLEMQIGQWREIFQYVPFYSQV